MKRPLALVCALFAGAIYVAACSSFSASPSDDTQDAAADASTADDAPACMPPACGGAGGRCGKVTACGLEFSCGDCAPPYACVEGTCKCTGATDVCAGQGATCGEVDNGCNVKTSCGTCDGGDSCQSKDGGSLACSSGLCADEPTTKTCTNRCHQATNNCGKVVPCGACPNAQLCGAAGVNTCSCPARSLPINQFYDGAGHFCYSQSTACPGQFNVVIARLYGFTTEGLVPLYRCHKGGSYLLTTSTACESVPGYTLEGPIGACATSALCGALPLHRYYNPTTGDLVHSLGATPPPNYSALGNACFVWPN